MTSLPWMSSQARTQRSQRMQASWLTLITGLESSSPRPVGHQQLGEDRALLLDLRAAGRDLHAVLARAHAGRGQDAPADVHGAHAADADRVVALVVAEHRDLDPGLLRGGVDRG